MTDRPVRAALVGTGSIARAHVEAVRACADLVELTAAVDVDEARCRTFSARHSIPHAYTDLDRMLAAERPNLVLICTPPAPHAALSITCLDAGAWVLCEKPLCGSLAEFDAIAAAERRGDAYCASVVQNRFGSASQHVKRLIESGELGRPLVGQCLTTWYRDDAYYAVPWHGRWTEALGGPTMQLGIHTMDLFLWLWPDWHDVFADVATLNHTMEVEDVSLALVHFRDGAMATIVNSAVSPRQETRMRLDFERATVEAQYLYRHRNADWHIAIPAHAAWTDDVARWRAFPEDVPSSHAAQLAEVLDSMATRRRPMASGEEARRTIEFVTCLYKSACTSQRVQRGSITLDDPFYRSVNGRPLDTPIAER